MAKIEAREYGAILASLLNLSQEITLEFKVVSECLEEIIDISRKVLKTQIDNHDVKFKFKKNAQIINKKVASLSYLIEKLYLANYYNAVANSELGEFRKGHIKIARKLRYVYNGIALNSHKITMIKTPSDISLLFFWQ